MKDVTKEWVEISDGDVKMADSGLRRKLPGQAIFHCQQAVEKMLKAILTEKDVSFPKTHDLVELADLGELDLSNHQRTVLARLSDQAVRSRYPGTDYNEGEISTLALEAKALYRWLLRQLT